VPAHTFSTQKEQIPFNQGLCSFFYVVPFIPTSFLSCIASATWQSLIVSAPSRSAIVLDTFMMRSYELALSRIFSNICFSRFCASSVNGHIFFSIAWLIWALQNILDFTSRSVCRCRAASTLSLIASDDSLSTGFTRSLYSTLGTWIWISIRSKSGPEIFLVYLLISFALQEHSWSESPFQPQGHGFIDAIRIILEGKANDALTLDILTTPSSNG
jgi:hypothetical protein